MGGENHPIRPGFSKVKLLFHFRGVSVLAPDAVRGQVLIHLDKQRSKFEAATCARYASFGIGYDGLSASRPFFANGYSPKITLVGKQPGFATRLVKRIVSR